ncbi:cytochrome P450 [Mycena galopus ATCC 62051]|nr:cytochrome P450 [Mycena galopus ATCC 62051]
MPSVDLSHCLICAVLSTTALYFGWLRTPSRSKLPLPPGPRKLPLVGNLFDMPAHPWEACMEWSKKYESDIIHLNLAGTSFIVLSSFEATEALLEKRSSIYSDRPPFPMLNDLMGWDFLLVLGGLIFTSRRTHRRLFDQELNLAGCHKFRRAQLVATHALLRLSNPSGFLDHLRQMAAEVIISVAYGIDTLPANDPYIALGEEAIKSLSNVMVPGRFLVDSIPILKYIPEWFPGAQFKRIAREGRLLSQAVRDIPFAETKRRMASGSAKSCFTVNALRHLESIPTYYQESTVQNVAAMMYLAGTDSLIAVLSTFILAMVANPDAQKKAQLEIDSVVGRGNLPDFNDEEGMPYVAALVKEVLRWKSVGPLGAPHRLTTEDEYRGYRLPAGSLVVGNIWGMHQDEVVYPDPHAFKPERFLLDGKINPAVRDPQSAFGFGRRICAGRHIAASSLWIAVVSMLAMFNITKEVGEDGQIIEPSYEYEGGVVFSPVPFKCTITPRSQHGVSAIQETSTET